MSSTKNPRHTSRRATVRLGLLAMAGTALGVSCVEAARPAPVSPTATAVRAPTAVPTSTPASTGVRSASVLMILAEKSWDMEFMLAKEVGVMTSTLEAAGYGVVMASESGENVVWDGAPNRATIEVAEVDPNAFRGLVLPCLAFPDITKPKPADKVGIAKAVAASGKPVAAQDGSVLLLGQAGVLNGRRYALSATQRLSLAPEAVEKGIWQEGAAVVQDGNVITASQCPYTARQYGRTDTTVELTQKLVEALKAAG